MIYVSEDGGWMVMAFASTEEQSHVLSSHFFQRMIGNLVKAVSLWLFLKIHLHSCWDMVPCPGCESFAVVAGV